MFFCRINLILTALQFDHFLKKMIKLAHDPIDIYCEMWKIISKLIKTFTVGMFPEFLYLQKKKVCILRSYPYVLKYMS